MALGTWRRKVPFMVACVVFCTLNEKQSTQNSNTNSDASHFLDLGCGSSALCLFLTSFSFLLFLMLLCLHQYFRCCFWCSLYENRKWISSRIVVMCLCLLVINLLPSQLITLLFLLGGHEKYSKVLLFHSTTFATLTSYISVLNRVL
jgi:hypothetical protein